MPDNYQTVRRDWGLITEFLKRAHIQKLRQAAESQGKVPMTLDEYGSHHLERAIPLKPENICLVDLELLLPDIDFSKLQEIFDGCPSEKVSELIKSLMGLYEEYPHLFESDIQALIGGARRILLKGLNTFLKQSPSHLKQLQTLRRNSTPLPKQVYKPFDTAISSMAESVGYASAMRDYLESLPLPACLTSKGEQRKHQTSHHEWNAAIKEAVDFFSRPETGIKAACTDAARLFQALFPATWYGPVETLGNKIYQRYFRIANPV